MKVVSKFGLALSVLLISILGCEDASKGKSLSSAPPSGELVIPEALTLKIDGAPQTNLDRQLESAQIFQSIGFEFFIGTNAVKNVDAAWTNFHLQDGLGNHYADNIEKFRKHNGCNWEYFKESGDDSPDLIWTTGGSRSKGPGLCGALFYDQVTYFQHPQDKKVVNDVEVQNQYAYVVKHYAKRTEASYHLLPFNEVRSEISGKAKVERNEELKETITYRKGFGQITGQGGVAPWTVNVEVEAKLRHFDQYNENGDRYSEQARIKILFMDKYSRVHKLEVLMGSHGVPTQYVLNNSPVDRFLYEGKIQRFDLRQIVWSFNPGALTLSTLWPDRDLSQVY